MLEAFFIYNICIKYCPFPINPSFDMFQHYSDHGTYSFTCCVETSSVSLLQRFNQDPTLEIPFFLQKQYHYRSDVSLVNEQLHFLKHKKKLLLVVHYRSVQITQPICIRETSFSSTKSHIIAQPSADPEQIFESLLKMAHSIWKSSEMCPLY